ncbi:hypothetical protein Tco_1018331 [Tanacetum coccineum]|uniref:Uncharacterized protein n=1 Tax=Tanacetum coccineum TaxID=301880 RepID=A0ABQ5FU22_9ASTR
MVPRTVLTRSGPISLNTARPVNTVQPRTAVNTIKGTRVNTTWPKVVLSAIKGNKGNAVKASACWVWRPKHKVLDHVSRNKGASMSFKRFDYIDVQGRSMHMTGNRFYLTDYEEIDGGFVSFRGQPKLGLWYHKDSPFDLVAYTDSDYAGASLDRKSTTGGCQFLGCRLISWQCKKQTVVANSTTEAEYIVASNCCGQNSKDSPDARFKPLGEEENMDIEDPGNENAALGKDSEVLNTREPMRGSKSYQGVDASINSTNNINTASNGNNTNNVNVVSSTVNAAGIEVNAVDPKTSIELPNDPNMPELEDIVYSDDDEGVGAEANIVKYLDAHLCLSVLFQLQEYTKIIQLNKLLET